MENFIPCTVQYDKYFPIFSYFVYLFQDPLAKWNNSKI